MLPALCFVRAQYCRRDVVRVYVAQFTLGVLDVACNIKFSRRARPFRSYRPPRKPPTHVRNMYTRHACPHMRRQMEWRTQPRRPQIACTRADICVLEACAILCALCAARVCVCVSGGHQILRSSLGARECLMNVTLKSVSLYWQSAVFDSLELDYCNKCGAVAPCLMRLPIVCHQFLVGRSHAYVRM